MYVKENSACTLINDNLIIDLPNGTLKQLLKKNYDVTKIKTILITHLHGDHTADIPFFLKYMFLNSDDKICIIGPKGIKKTIKKLFEVYYFSEPQQFKDGTVEFIEIEKTIEISNYKIEAYNVKHGKITNCLAYVINNQLGLTGDACMCNGIQKIFEKSKLVVCDTSTIVGDNCHLGVNEVKKLVRQYNVRVIPTHMRKVTKEYLMRKKIKNIQLFEDFSEIEI